MMAIINTRSAHGVLGMDELHIALDGAMPKARGQDPRVAAASWKVWWLSPPVPRHLHQQTEGTTNHNQNGDRLNAVWNAMKMTSDCGKS